MTTKELLKRAEKVVNLAYEQIGTDEDKNGRVIYSEEYGFPGQPWCMMFLWWLYKHAGYSKIFYGGGKTASCSALLRWAQANGYVVKNGRYGDIVIWSFRTLKDGTRETSHCGLVTRRNFTSTTSVEGNTSGAGSQDNGGHTMERTRSNKYVLAYIRLPYELL